MLFQCARYCLESTDFVCRSFGYKIGERECFLSDKNSNSPGANRKFSAEYDLYELISQQSKFKYPYANLNILKRRDINTTFKFTEKTLQELLIISLCNQTF